MTFVGIYEGTRDIHTLMQADWALGLKKEKATRRMPPWKSHEAQTVAL
jgi:glutaryl-CoA dehydrogenase (non-decarboxylating)